MKYFLNMGETRDITMPDHTLNNAIGFVTFTLNNINEDKPIQWSVVGARKSELITSPNKKYANKCRVWVQPDQWNEGERIINVSAIGTETGANKTQTETKATLTVKNPAAEAEGDFSMRIHVTEGIKLSADGNTVTPANSHISVYLSEDIVETSNISNFSGEVWVDGPGMMKAQKLILTKGDVGNSLKVDSSAFENIIKQCHDIVSYRDFATLSATVHVSKHATTHEELYSHTSGVTFTVTKG